MASLDAMQRDSDGAPGLLFCFGSGDLAIAKGD
jgi:hypothetical protein